MKPTEVTLYNLVSAETTILRALLEADGGFVSGGALAKELSLSRVAVWQHMEKLRVQGFEFEAVRAKGYRLVKRPEGIHPNLVLAFLGSRKLQFRLLWCDEIDSTNDEAARQLTGGSAAPLIVLAKRQTKGRGRFGRTWHSEANGNLYISFGFRPALSHEKMQTFTLWMGVSICDLVAKFTRTSPGLKWPNDILFDGKKAGGMLTEARIDSDQIRDLVFGLGLNLNSTSSWPDDLAQRAISLAQHLQTPLDVNRFCAALIGRVLDAYAQFIEGKHLHELADGWNRHDTLRGKEIAVLQGPKRFTGTALGIDNEGALIVRAGNGRSERFRAGEVTLEKKPLPSSP